jgi:hypothetical protein
MRPEDDGKPWVGGVAPSVLPPSTGADASTGFTGDAPVDPGALLGLLKSAARQSGLHVRVTGPQRIHPAS